jgi:hypothetical protein
VDLSTQPPFQKCAAFGLQFVVGSVLDTTLARCMNDQCTLLGLLGFVFADIDQRSDHPVEGIHVIVEENDLPLPLFERKNL